MGLLKVVRYVISKDTTSASKPNNNDSDEAGRDDSVDNVSHLIRMHQPF